MANRYGSLGLDRPHNLKVDGFYQFDLKKAGAADRRRELPRAVGYPAQRARRRAPGYGAGESYLLPRGAVQRSPITTQRRLHFAYGYA